MNHLDVYPNMTLVHFQLHFHELFPYLQVEPLASMATSNHSELTLGDLAESARHTSFLIDGDMTVAKLETDFRQCMDLTIWVERRMGFTWHDTDSTRHWTLNQQNERGAAATLPTSTIHH